MTRLRERGTGTTARTKVESSTQASGRPPRRMNVFYRLMATAAWLLTGCQSELPSTSQHLETLTDADLPVGPGEFCSLEVEAGGMLLVLMRAKGGRAIVRTGGRAVTLLHRGGQIKDGGLFQSGALRVEVTGVRAWRVFPTQPMSRGVRVTVQNRHQTEVFSGLWSCGP